jgi:hypothetical protein
MDLLLENVVNARRSIFYIISAPKNKKTAEAKLARVFKNATRFSEGISCLIKMMRQGARGRQPPDIRT